MKAIHVNWSKPRIYGTGSFFIEDFDILTTILSALKWREHNGEIKLVTDSIGYEFYKSRGMCRLWNEIDTNLDDIPDSINPSVFWAAGKLFALKNCSAPIAVMDTDFIVWDKLAFNNFEDLTVIHSEDIYPDVYPDINYFKMKRGYIFNCELDWRVRPLNTAFYVIKNEEFKKAYTDEAINFMDNALGEDTLKYMVFAEQRLMAMSAKRIGTKIKEISSLESLFYDGERYFTHIWGMKQQMRDETEMRHEFCCRCIQRIKKDFPKYAEMLNGIDELKVYL